MTPCRVSLLFYEEFDLFCQMPCQFVPLWPQLEASTHSDTNTHSYLIVPPGVPVDPTLPLTGCDKETMIYLLCITINLLVWSRPSRRSPVFVCLCVFVWMCLIKSELPGPVTHTPFLHACACVRERMHVCVCDSQTSDSMLGMRRYSRGRLPPALDARGAVT